MKPVTQSHLLRCLNILDWSGHVELGDHDKLWLAGELAVFLSGGDESTCEICGFIKPIVVRTTLGYICEDCIENISDEAEEIREQLQEDDE